ncbi:MAG: phenylalanine--tRNA ligase subunit beta [Bacteroidota bacterium]
MKISYNWLKQYLVPSEGKDLGGAEHIAKLLTDCGLEVENVKKYETVKGGLTGCVIGEVKTKEKHPNADRLNITTVDIDTGTLLNIVCGASNVAAGQKVVVAPVGTILHPTKGEPFELKKAKIRGVVSEGMICAEDEVGLGEMHEGIMVLDASAKIGTSAKDYFKIEDDYILEIGLTPNRADAASHIGVAKDLFAVLNFQHEFNENKIAQDGDEEYKLNIPFVDDFSVENNNIKIEVEVTDKQACPRYSGVAISGVQIKESPDWLKKRLFSIGINPINNIVDITNFVLHELGQPIHAFDADKISGEKIIVKKLPAGTKFITLDETERTLSENDLMICDAEEPMCIAGVLGGIKSGVTNETKNIFLESAYFAPSLIRRTVKHHGLRTDASFRFEQGTDLNITVYVLQRAALLIKEIAGGTISSDIIDIYPNPVEENKIAFSYYNCCRLIGKQIDHSHIKRILILLGIEIISEGDDALLLSVSTDKTDITTEADIIEEILRIYGYNDIKISSLIRSSLPYSSKPDTEKIRNTISDLLCGSGFTEIMSNSLTNKKYLSLLSSNSIPENKEQEKIVSLLNPISPELNILRPTLLFSGLEAILYNQNRKNSDLKLFEFGKTYTSSGSITNTSHKEEEKKNADSFTEENHLALFLCGKKNNESWNVSQENVDFFYLKTFVDNILKRLGIKAEQVSMDTSDIFSLGLSLESRKKKIAELGFVKKSFMKKFDIKQDVFYADFNWDVVIELLKEKSLRYKKIAKFPTVRRDLALLIDKNIKYEQLKSLAYQTEKNLLKEVNLFDIYEGEKIGTEKKSYALSFILQDKNLTLTDNQVDEVMKKLVKTFSEKFGAIIRK